MVDRVLRWLMFHRYPRLRWMLGELAELNPERKRSVGHYAAARCRVWRAIAMEVLYGRTR